MGRRTRNYPPTLLAGYRACKIHLLDLVAACWGRAESSAVLSEGFPHWRHTRIRAARPPPCRSRLSEEKPHWRRAHSPNTNAAPATLSEESLTQTTFPSLGLTGAALFTPQDVKT